MHKNLPRRTALVLSAVLLSGAVVAATPTVAVADDNFDSSYPVADSTISGSPDEISLMFTGTLNNEAGATIIEVLDEGGEDVAVDSPTVSGQSITQHLSPEAADGLFTVRWKTVSGDGHPISGQFSYTVGQPGPSTKSAPPATPSPNPSPSPEESDNTTEEPEPAPARQTYGGTPSGGAESEMLPVFFVGGLAVILGFGVVGVILAGRRRHQHDRAQASRDTAAGEGGHDA